MGSPVSTNQGCLLLAFGLVLALAALDLTVATGKDPPSVMAAVSMLKSLTWDGLKCCVGAGACAGTTGLDYVGGEVVNNGKSEITDSDEECCQKCSARSGELGCGGGEARSGPHVESVVLMRPAPRDNVKPVS